MTVFDLLVLVAELFLTSSIRLLLPLDSGFERVLQVFYQLLTCLQNGYLLPCLFACDASLPDLKKVLRGHIALLKR